MPEPLIIGDSPADWSRQRSALLPYYSGQTNINEQFRRSALSAEEASRVGARGEDESARRFEVERGRLASDDARRWARLNFTDRYAMEQAALKRADDLAKEARSDKWLQDVQRPLIESQTKQNLAYLSPAAERQMQLTQQSIDDRVKQGLIESPEQVMQLDPSASRPWAEMRAMESQNRRRAIEAEAAQVENIARTMTKFEQADRARKAAALLPKTPENDAMLAQTTKNWSELSNEVARLRKDKSGLVDYVTMGDEATGTYRSAYPPLAWKRAVEAALTPEARKAAAVARRAALPAQKFGSLETMSSVGNPFGFEFNANREYLALPLDKSRTPRRRRYATPDEVLDAFDRHEISEEEARQELAPFPQ